MPAALFLAVAGLDATPGGIAAVSRNLARALCTPDSPFQLAEVLSLLESDADRPAWLPPTVRFRGCAASRARFARLLIGGALRQRRVVFDHVTLALPLLSLAQIGVVRTAVLAHGSESWRRIRRGSRWSFAAADVVLTNSHYTLARMRDAGVHGNLVACPLGLPAEVPLQTNAPPPAGALPMRAVDGSEQSLSTRLFLLAGRMLASERGKGHDLLLAALPQVRERHADAQLLFAGPGDDRERLAQLARSLGLGDCVFIPGEVAREQLDRFHAAAFAYAMPSRQEGFGLAYLEAMNFSRPCIGCRGDGAQDVIVDGETGLLLEHCDDAGALAHAMLDLLDRPARAAAMGAAGLRRLRAHFTAAQYRERLLTALAEHLR